MDHKNWESMTEEEKQKAKENWRMMHGRRWGRGFGWHSPVGLGIFLLLGALALSILVHSFGGGVHPMMWR